MCRLKYIKVQKYDQKNVLKVILSTDQDSRGSQPEVQAPLRGHQMVKDSLNACCRPRKSLSENKTQHRVNNSTRLELFNKNPLKQMHFSTVMKCFPDV